MPYKNPEDKRRYQREWAADKAAKAPPEWHAARKTTKAFWRVRKGKAYFRRKYRAMIKRFAEKGLLEAFRADHAQACKDWKNKIFLEELARAKPPTKYKRL